MVLYNFESAVNRRNTGSNKWDSMLEENPNIDENIFPFSVADADIPLATEIRDGLKSYLDTAVLGYTSPTKDYNQAVINWMYNRHNWTIQTEWLVQSAGVVNALTNCIHTFTAPKDGIIIMEPVYYPFAASIEVTGRTLVNCGLIDNSGHYEIDFDLLEKQTAVIENKMLILCSPHNPIGRVWTKNELEKIAEICLANNVLIISDEIHSDLIMPGHKHIMLGSLSEEIAQNSIVCTAPSKTFNLAGLQTSNIIIPNKALREKYQAFTETQAFNNVNILGLKACELAYTKADKWLAEFLQLIQHNHEILKDFLAQHLPEIKVYDLEGTYLQWMDFSSLGKTPEALEVFLKQEAQIFFDEGYIFGESGRGFERMNLACPTKTMVAALERLVAAVKK